MTKRYEQPRKHSIGTRIDDVTESVLQAVLAKTGQTRSETCHLALLLYLMEHTTK